MQKVYQSASPAIAWATIPEVSPARTIITSIGEKLRGRMSIASAIVEPREMASLSDRRSLASRPRRPEVTVEKAFLAGSPASNRTARL